MIIFSGSTDFPIVYLTATVSSFYVEKPGPSFLVICCISDGRCRLGFLPASYTIERSLRRDDRVQPRVFLGLRGLQVVEICSMKVVSLSSSWRVEATELLPFSVQGSEQPLADALTTNRWSIDNFICFIWKQLAITNTVHPARPGCAMSRTPPPGYDTSSHRIEPDLIDPDDGNLCSLFRHPYSTANNYLKLTLMTLTTL